MTALRHISIKSKLLMVYITITGLILTSAFFIIMRMEQTSSRQNVISGLNVVGEIVADRCAASVAFSDVQSANSNLSTLSSHASIVYACIRTDTNQSFAQYAVNDAEQYNCDDFDIDTPLALMVTMLIYTSQYCWRGRRLVCCRSKLRWMS